jgi:hypothetical protein
MIVVDHSGSLMMPITHRPFAASPALHAGLSQSSTSPFPTAPLSTCLSPAPQNPGGDFDMLRYERACEQAIAMCYGNLRSTIKALILANEYLEMELRDVIARSAEPGSGEIIATASDAA